jgi:acetylornithine deacetylase
VGVIAGGQAVNVVPDRCWIELDRRTLPGESPESVLQPVAELLRNVSGWEFEPPHLSVPAMEVPADAPCVVALSQAVDGVAERIIVESAQYATDAGVYNAAGIPTVVFGPGDIAQAHTAREFIEIGQMLQAVQIIKNVLTR